MRRLTSTPAFWDARYQTERWAFGTAPSPILEEEAGRFAPGARVVDVGAGEGRNALVLARQGCRATALDFAAEGLRKAAVRAEREGLALEVVEADLTRWQPAPAAFDGAVCAFVHLLPDERVGLYRAIQTALRPGGVLVAEWFTPHQLCYQSGGPSSPDRLVSPAELRAAFADGEILRIEAGERVLDEGSFLQGPAHTVRFVFRKSGSS